MGYIPKIAWLVVWNIFYFSYIGNNIPTDFIFFRGVGIPPTSYDKTPDFRVNRPLSPLASSPYDDEEPLATHDEADLILKCIVNPF